MKNKNVFLGSIVCCSVFFTDFAFAKCLSNPNQFPECRYPEGDSWCAERSRETPYAYTDKCLEQLQGNKPKQTTGKKSQKNLITIFGLNIEMNDYEIYNEMSRRGYSCERSIDEEMVSFIERSIDYESHYLIKTPLITCKKGDSVIAPKIEARYGNNEINSIYFDCGVFSTCGLTLREAAQILVDSTNVKSLSPTRFKGLDGKPLYGKEFALCGSGPLQDRVCIFDSKSVQINRGYLGSSKPSYR